MYPTGIGRWDIMSDTLIKASKQWSWQHKKKVAFFRGSRTSGERDDLVRLSRRKSELVDARYTKNQAWKSKEDTLGMEPAVEVTFEDHCRYKYLFNFRGVAASFRFKHLFLCGSLVLHVGSDWLEFFYPSMKPWIHYVPVNAGASQEEIEDLIEFLHHHDDKAEEIAMNGHAFIRDHLKMSDIETYWLALLKKYAEKLAFKPVPDKNNIIVTRTKRH
jgi:protein glucosyltransferase